MEIQLPLEKCMQFSHFHFSFQGMLSPRMLAEDIRTMCKMIDEMAVLPREDAGQNTVIYETCAYMHQVFLPTVLNHNITFF